MDNQPITELSRNIHYTLSSIFLSKLRNFFKRSLLKYLIASIAFYYASKMFYPYEDNLQLLGIIFLGLVALSLLTILVSTYLQFKAKKDQGFLLTLRENTITITSAQTGEVQEKGWNWIRQVELQQDIYFFDLNETPKEGLLWKRTSLTPDEDTALQTWLSKHNKLRP